MKVREHIDTAADTLFSYEIVPPPRGRTVKDIVDIVKKLAPYKPPWIDVTAHSASAYYQERPDGSIERKVYKKRPGTIGICGIIQNRFKIDAVTHLLCHGFTKAETEDALIELNYLGVENVFAIRGDGLNYNKRIAPGRKVNTRASDLVAQIEGIRQGRFLEELSGARPMDFCVGVAGYPEKHFEAPNLATDIQFLKNKIDLGADYIVTQMFYDNESFYKFVKDCKKAGITVPIIPGLKVLRSKSQLNTIPKNFHINFPEKLTEKIAAEPERMEEIGLEWACEQVQGLLDFKVPSIHFYVMNDADTVINVIKEFRQAP